MNLLIAEDNRIIQELTESLMDMWGYDYDLASDGLEAVDFAKKNEGKYDLCLMDIDMPKMNGLEATGIIRKRLKYLPIIAMTGNSGYKRKCLRARMDDFITKPYNLDRLHDKINELTIKVLQIRKDHDKIILEKEMPMDQQHAQELRELAKKGLIKMSIKGIGGHDTTVIVHKNVPNKISRDFIEREQDIVVFIDRNEDKPAKCHLYKLSHPMPSIYLQPDDIEEEIKEEDDDLKDCAVLILKKET